MKLLMFKVKVIVFLTSLMSSFIYAQPDIDFYLKAAPTPTYIGGPVFVTFDFHNNTSQDEVVNIALDLGSDFSWNIASPHYSIGWICSDIFTINYNSIGGTDNVVIITNLLLKPGYSSITLKSNAPSCENEFLFQSQMTNSTNTWTILSDSDIVTPQKEQTLLRVINPSSFELFTPNSVTSSTQWSAATPNYTIDNSGMNGNGINAKHDNPGTFNDCYLRLDPETDGFLSYNFNNIDLTGVALWNINIPYQTGDAAAREFQVIVTSSSGVNTIGSYVLADDSSAQYIHFNQVYEDVTNVRLNVINSWFDCNGTGSKFVSTTDQTHPDFNWSFGEFKGVMAPLQSNPFGGINISQPCDGNIVSLSINDTSGINSINWVVSTNDDFSSPIENITDFNPTITFPNPGTYYVFSELNLTCYSDTLYDTIIVLPPPVPVNLGNDTTYCEGQPVLTLDAGSGYDFYFWQGVDTTQTYTADTSGQYIVEVANVGENLVFNGDFEQGNTGFYSQYNYPIVGPPDNNYQVESSVYSCTADHTTGSGLFYAAGGFTATNEKAWCQNIDLISGQKYVLSYFGASFNSPNPALIQFSVDGNLISTSKQLSSTTCVWDPFYEIWESTITGNVEVCILNQTASFQGNDFMLDDIVIAPLCTTSDTINVLVGESPVADFSFIDSCEYDAVTYNDLSSITSSESISTWSWDIDNDGVEDYSTSNPSHTFTAGNYNTKLTVTSALGCTKDTTMPLVIFEQPEANFTYNNECIYDSVGFIDNSTIPAPGLIATHAWNFGEFTTPLVQSTVSAPYHTYDFPGDFNVIHVVGSANGCLDTIIQQVTVFDEPIAAYSVSDTCDNIPLTFTDNTITSTPITTWEWDFGDLNNGSNETEVHTYAMSGTYNTNLVVIDNNGCSDTVSQSLTINPTPLADFATSVAMMCSNQPFQAFDISGINISTWNWDMNSDGIEDYSTQNITHQYPTVGTFDIRLIVTSNEGCSDTTTNQIIFHPLPEVSFSASTECVNGTATNFVNTSSISSGSNQQYFWVFGDGNTSSLENPSNNYQIASNYDVKLYVVSDSGCIDSVTYSVEVLGKPTGAYSQDTTGGCAPLCVTFTDTSYDDIPIIEWNWKFENGYFESAEQNPTFCYTATGDYDVGLIIKNAQGCKDTLEQAGLVTIFPLPTSDFTLTPESTDVINSTIDFTNNSLDASAWIWDFGDDSEENLTEYNPSYSYADTGVYEVQLVVINATLCSDTSYQTVEILPVDDLFVPSAFSPNGDGKNDVLYARGYIGAMYFAIFDRLGKKVFESEDKETGWDGMINGKNALEGVYSWYLQAEVNGTAYKLKGDVTLVR